MKKARNGYIDIVKFIFALIIVEFHLGTGIFPDGRLAVDGFFMITGFLMMKSIERDRNPLEKTGISTVRFLFHKYAALFPFLIPSVLIGFVVYSVMIGRTFLITLQRFPLLSFDIFPLQSAGYKGDYVVGISWYLSSMFLALAVLYPLSRKYKSSFVLTCCPLFAFLFYGTLSGFYGNIAVGPSFLKNAVFNTGLMRALGGCSLGCLIYEISNRVKDKKPTHLGRAVFTIAELVGFTYLFYAMHHHPLSAYDYVLVYVIFGVLIIGICGLSYTTYLWRGRWTKPFGIASTLLVLNHYCWMLYFKQLFGAEYTKTNKVLHFVCAVAAACVAVYLASLLIKLIGKAFQKLKLFKVSEQKAE